MLKKLTKMDAMAKKTSSKRRQKRTSKARFSITKRTIVLVLIAAVVAMLFFVTGLSSKYQKLKANLYYSWIGADFTQDFVETWWRTFSGHQLHKSFKSKETQQKIKLVNDSKTDSEESNFVDTNTNTQTETSVIELIEAENAQALVELIIPTLEQPCDEDLYQKFLETERSKAQPTTYSLYRNEVLEECGSEGTSHLQIYACQGSLWLESGCPTILGKQEMLDKIRTIFEEHSFRYLLDVPTFENNTYLTAEEKAEKYYVFVREGDIVFQDQFSDTILLVEKGVGVASERIVSFEVFEPDPDISNSFNRLDPWVYRVPSVW